jgi:uncharacterized protein (DUF1330 family)
MSAYVISEVEIVDELVAKNYMKLAETSILEHGGRYLVRGAIPEVMEGNPTNRRIVIVEFPTIERAREWYVSVAYAQALQFRDKALNRQLAFVDGVIPFSNQ